MASENTEPCTTVLHQINRVGLLWAVQRVPHRWETVDGDLNLVSYGQPETLSRHLLHERAEIAREHAMAAWFAPQRPQPARRPRPRQVLRRAALVATALAVIGGLVLILATAGCSLSARAGQRPAGLSPLSLWFMRHVP